MYVGWNWATETHDVTVMDENGRRAEGWEFPHTEEGFARTPARLRRHGAPAELPVAIETTRGLAVDRLLAAGHPIVPIHPNAFHAVRPRWGAAKAKTDAGDGMKLADYLRTDGHQLRRLTPTDPRTLELQALTRQRADHVEAKVAAVNQFDALWLGGKAVFADRDSDITLDFLDAYPTPQAAAKLAPAKLEAWCKRRGYSGKRSGRQLIERMRAAPAAATRLPEAAVATLIRI